MMRMSLRTCRSAWTVLVLTALFLTACDEDNDEKTNEQDTEVDAGSADAISGATPGVKSAALTASHDGQGKADCFECHDSFHVNNYSIGDCVSCHGSNGAPNRPESHKDLECESCHDSVTKHPNLNVENIDACRGCHATTHEEDSECAYSETYDVAVIGGGGGGLAAAAQLAKAGKSVVLVEQHYKVGGCMVTFDRGGYTFEASLHAYDGWGLSYINSLGIQDDVTPLNGETMYRIVLPDLTFDVPTEKSEYREALKETFPDEADNIDALFERFTVMGEGYPGMSLSEALEFHGIEDEALVGIFTIFSGFLADTPENIPADEFVSMWDSFHQMGYYYFEGGSQSISDALEAVVTENDGVIKRYTRASEITMTDGKATGIKTEDGGCYSTSAVISNANAKATYLKLLGKEHLPDDFADAVENAEVSSSHLAMIFLGVDQDYSEQLSGVPHEIFVETDNYHTPDEIDDVQCLPEAADYTITNYSAIDPTAAPEGKNAIVITVDFMGYDCNNAWQFNESYKSYEDYKLTIAEAMVARAESQLPGLSDHIEVMEVASPITIEQFTLNPKGAWAGWAFGPENETLATENAETPVEGLFMAGAWIGGAGQSVALSTGISAANAVTEYLNP